MNEKNNMPFSIEQLSEMNAFECLWNCSKDHLNDIAITYKADLCIQDKNKKVLTNKISYRELIDNIIRTYYSLKTQGVKKGDVITYSSITTPELIYTAYASILLGSIFKPIDVRFGSDELLSQFDSTPSKIFFGAKPFVDKILPIYGDLGVEKIVLMDFQESLPGIIRLGSKLQEMKIGCKIPKELSDNIFSNWSKFKANTFSREIPDISQVKLDDIIHITATTGTTGKPKMLLHNSSNWNAQLYNASNCGLNFVRGDTFFNCTVPWVDFGLINAIHTFLCNGIRIDLDPLWSADKNADYIIKNDPNWWMGAPGWLDELFTNSKYANVKLENSRYFITGGAPLYPHKHELYQSRLSEMSFNGRIAPGYGYSEGSAAISLDLENKATTIGRMWPLVQPKIVNRDTGKEVIDGECGELWITSIHDKLTQISPGYLNNDEAMNENFTISDDGKIWARSGDVVRKNDDGTYSWISRYKNILTFNGFNIDCEKISEKVGTLSDITKVVVFGCVASDGNQMPIICVEKNPGTMVSDKEIEERVYNYMLSNFPDYYMPRDIIIYDKFPVISMKTDIQLMKSYILLEDVLHP